MNYWASWSDSWQKWWRMTRRWGSKATVVMVNVANTVFSHQRGCRSVFILVAWVKFMAQIYEPLFSNYIYWHLKFYLLKLVSIEVGVFCLCNEQNKGKILHSSTSCCLSGSGLWGKQSRQGPRRTSLSQDPHRGTPSHFPLWNNQVINLLIIQMKKGKSD